MITGALQAAKSAHFKIEPALRRTIHTRQAEQLLGGETLWESSVTQCWQLGPKGGGELQCSAVPLTPMDWLHRAQPLWPGLHAPVQDASKWACSLALGGSL